jgi:hypothetical protein
LKAGYIFSLVLTALPGAWAVIAWLITVVTRMVQKLDPSENTRYRQAGFEGTKPTLRDDFSRM